MRIAIVVNTSWNIFNFRKGLIKAFLERGDEVIAIAPFDKYSTELENIGCSYYPIKIENKGSNPIKDLKLIFNFYKLYKKVKPDIILHFTIKPNIYGTIAAKMVGIPVINNVSGLGTVFLHANFTSSIAKLLYKIAFRFPKKVFFQNKEDQSVFIENKLVLKDITSILPGSGVDTTVFKPLISKVKNAEFTFLMVSRLLYDKGIIEFIEAIKILKSKIKECKFKFQIVGMIDESANLGVSQNKVKEWVGAGLIEYFPFTDGLLPFYYKADCVVLPSYREGTPRSLLEAGACGIPLISTNVPGCKDVIIEGGNGFLCKAKDFVSLALAMEKMIRMNEEEYHAYSKMSRSHIVKNYDENIVINMYFEAIEKAMLKKDKL